MFYKVKIKKAIIPAAGLGTRLLPATKAQPKAMLPIGKKPMIQYIVEEAVMAGIEDIFIITGRNSLSIEEHFEKNIELEIILKDKNKEEELEIIKDIRNLANFVYIHQKEPLGLGHAVLRARQFIRNEPFAVLTSDDVIHAKKPCIEQMATIYEKKGHTVLGVQQVGWNNVHKYGIVDADNISDTVIRVNQLREKPALHEATSDLAVLGRYIIDPDIFDILENTVPGSGGEIQLTDALNVLAAQQPVWAYNFEGRRYDLGSHIGILEANIEYALRDKELSSDLIKFMSEILDSTK